MSKIALHIGIIIFLAVALTSPALAQFKLGPDCNPALPPNPTDEQINNAIGSYTGDDIINAGNPCDVYSFISWIKKLINILFMIAIPLGAISVVWGGFVIMTAAGNPSKVEKGKQIITAAVIGLAITFGAWIIITALNFFITGPFQFR